MDRQQALTNQFMATQELNGAVEFIYQKANGNLSVRTVLPRGVQMNARTGKPYLNAYDLGRKGLRRFSLENIHGEPVPKEKPPEGYDSEQYEPEEF